MNNNVSGNNLSRNLYSFGMNVEKTTQQAFKSILKPINQLINPNFEKLQSDITRYDEFNKYLNYLYDKTDADHINFQA